MTQQMDLSTKKKSLPIAGQELDIDAELAAFEAEERERLGLAKSEQWVEDMADLGFTKAERGKVTLLLGGLTQAQDYLVQGALANLGYNVIALDVPDNAALQVGKEFGNRAQCNPTYFTVGNLVKYLITLRDKHGMTAQEVVDRFVFVTAGACGPCRFGMYITEYRKALRDAGFDGFRVMLFQQQGGLSQATGEEVGLEMNPPFFLALVKGMVAGDVLNGVAYRVRPYEVNAGDTDKAFDEAKQICHDALAEGRSILWALWKSRHCFAKVEVDRARLKPKTAIIGEFWAMTTEGDGNYALQKFLQSEGSEVDIQFLSAWLLYNIWEVRFDTANRAGLRAQDHATQGLGDKGEFGVFSLQAALFAADKLVRGIFQTFAHTVGYTGYVLADMDEVAEVAAPFYNNDLRGGEGHMEVGKLIINVVKQKANMTLSVKPFGCMPSSGVSDGVQSLITERYPGTIYCAVETSGDGAVNFYSRVQMYLFKAKQAAQLEYEEALKTYGITEEQFRDYLRGPGKHLNRALYHPPHVAGSTTTDMVHKVGELMTTTRWQRAVRRLDRAQSGLREWSADWAQNGPARVRKSVAVGREMYAELAEIARDKGPGVAEQTLQAAQRKAATVLPFIAKQPRATPETSEPIAAE